MTLYPPTHQYEPEIAGARAVFIVLVVLGAYALAAAMWFAGRGL